MILRSDVSVNSLESSRHSVTLVSESKARIVPLRQHYTTQNEQSYTTPMLCKSTPKTYSRVLNVVEKTTVIKYSTWLKLYMWTSEQDDRRRVNYSEQTGHQ